MNRRDFLRLSTKGRARVLELSCEHLYLRYVDARAASSREGQGGSGPGAPSWEGEPPTEIAAQTTDQLFEELERRLSDAAVLRVLDPDWLAGEDFRLEVEARFDAFRRRGGRVEVDDPARPVPQTGQRATGTRP